MGLQRSGKLQQMVDLTAGAVFLSLESSDLCTGAVFSSNFEPWKVDLMAGAVFLSLGSSDLRIGAVFSGDFEPRAK